jgi:hypothetical protein
MCRRRALLGFSPSRSWVEIDDMSLRTRMGWAFHLDVTVPASAVPSASASGSGAGEFAAGADAGS